MQNKVKQYGGLSFQYNYAGGLSPFDEVIYYSKNGNIDNDISNIANISKLFLDTDIGVVQVGYYVNNIESETVNILRKDIEEYKSGKTNLKAYYSKWAISNANQAVSTSVQSPGIKYPELFSNDGKTYLGKLSTNIYDTDSIYNEYGNYGSKYQSDSIWNTYGDYGSKYSSTSAFNKYASDPPIIVLEGKIVGSLTINSTINGAISPYELLEWLEDQGF